MPVGGVMNSGNNSHNKDNGTVITNDSRSSSCHSRALQGVTGSSVAQQSIALSLCVSVCVCASVCVRV